MKQTEERKTIKRTMQGVVVGVKMDRSAVVKVTSRKAHPLYKKIVSKTKKYLVHMNEVVVAGDRVIIESTRPISKRKSWRIKEVIKK